MQERLGKFGLEIETSKSRVIEFGRYAKERRKRKGKGKPLNFWDLHSIVEKAVKERSW